MVSRRNLKSHHENAVLDGFSVDLEALSSSFEVLSKPDPPDAIVKISGHKTWVEITDAFLDNAHAEGLTSGAADDIAHISDERRLIGEPDETFGRVLIGVIEKNIRKPQCKPLYPPMALAFLLCQ
jgi:hypothetical protein